MRNYNILLLMENLNNTPLLILRNNNKQFKAKQRLLNRRVKNKQHLRQEIYSNHNIFQSSINLYRNMTAQNLIWDKNYNYKCIINTIKQENNSLKARIWNVEKQNRKMERQIDSWNLNQFQASSLAKKPYIDMATVQKVVADQDYNIVSLKMQIFQLEKQLEDRSRQFQAIQDRNKDTSKIISVFNHEIADKKMEICQFIEGERQNSRGFEKGYRQKMSVKILQQSQTIDLIAKNTQIKKKSNINIENELTSITHECQLQKNITYMQVQRLNEETRLMKAEQDGGINIEKERLKLAEKNRLDYECYMQSQMGGFIKTKMPLQLEIERLKEALASFENQEGDRKKNRVSID